MFIDKYFFVYCAYIYVIYIIYTLHRISKMSVCISIYLSISLSFYPFLDNYAYFPYISNCLNIYKYIIFVKKILS